MPTVFDVLLHAIRALDVAVEGETSGDGSTTTLVDSRLGAAWAGREDDEFNNGCVFLKTNVLDVITDEAVGSVAGAVTFLGALDIYPAASKLIILNTPGGGGITAYGIPDIGTITSGGDTVTGESVSGTSGTLAKRNLTTGHIDFSDAGGIVATDGGAGVLVIPSTVTAVGTIDYVTGDWTYTGAATLVSVTYRYSYVVGTTDFSGAILLSFSEARTGAITATYTPSLTLFVPDVKLVTDFDSTTGTVTFSPAQVVKISTLATYAVSTRRYPLWLLLQKLNEVLSEIDDYVSSTAVLATAIVNDEYLLADTLRIIRIWEGESAGDRRWSPVTRYHRVSGVLHFDQAIAAANVLIETVGPAPVVTLTTASVSDQYSREWLGLAVAVKCCRWRMLQGGADDRLLATQLADLTARERAALWNKTYQPQQKNFPTDFWPVDKWDGQE